MREYYARLLKEIEKGALRRITDLETGEEGIYRESELLLSTPGYKESDKTIEELITIAPTLVLFGFGHIGKAVYKIARMLNMRLVIFDDRKDVKDDDEYDAEFHLDDYRALFSSVYSFENPYFLIFTHGHKADQDALCYTLKNYANARYIGMIGSRKKIELTYDALEKKGIDKNDLKRVHAPIGLDINAESPAEIAISIMAEIIRTYREDKNQTELDSSMLKYLSAQDERAVLIRIVETSGSGPRKKGTEMAVTEKSLFLTIGGGAIEKKCIDIARSMLKENKTFCIKDFSLNPDGNLGMACGGEAKVLFKLIEP